MRSYWRLPCVVAVEILLLSECVSARFTPNNVGFVGRSTAEEHDATKASTGTVTSASTGSMQRSSGFYFGEERRRSTTAVALRMPWSSFCSCTPIGCSLRTTTQTGKQNTAQPTPCVACPWYDTMIVT